MVLVKYRFYRRDSPRGTTQASVTVGPKIPTAGLTLTGANGSLLPGGLQPGSGSTDFFVGGVGRTPAFSISGDWSRMRIFTRLSAPGNAGDTAWQRTRSRFWLSYRPYESKNVAREWFIGPVLTWLYSQDERIAGVTQKAKRRQRAVVGSRDLRRRSSGNACLARHGLGCCAFHGYNLHARPQSYQFRNHSAVSAAPLRKGDNDEQEKTSRYWFCSA